MKLEKIEFGGIHGRCLSEMVVDIFVKFQELTGKFSSSTCDVLDVHNQVCIYYMVHVHVCNLINFVQVIALDLAYFREKIAQFDRRLASIFNRAFQDCSGLESALKVCSS